MPLESVDPCAFTALERIIQFVFRVCYNGAEGITNSDPP